MTRKKRCLITKRPTVAAASFIVADRMVVPVMWDVGPVVCGFCGHVSQSSQALYKHMRDCHTEEIEEFRAERQMNTFHHFVFDASNGDEFTVEDGGMDLIKRGEKTKGDDGKENGVSPNNGMKRKRKA